MTALAKIWNTSSEDIEFGDWSIPANAVLVAPIAEYVETAASVDARQVGVDVELCGIGSNDVSISSFGAVGDGVSDDTEPVQSAIDFVRGNGGGKVRVPAGVFLVRHVLADGVDVVGTSGRHSVLKSAGSGDDAVLTLGGRPASASNIHVTVGTV